MNAKQIVAAVSIAFAGTAALAAPSQAPLASSTLTRAEVRAELAQAQRDGTLRGGEATVFADQTLNSTTTRAQVRDDARHEVLARVSAAGFKAAYVD